MGSFGFRVIRILALVAAGCGEDVGTGGQRLPLPEARPVDFGAVVERTTKTVEVWVENPLAEPLEIVPPPDAPPFGAALYQPVTLAGGERLPLSLVFAPEGAGLATLELVIRSQGGPLARFALSGLGVADQGLRCDEGVDFGTLPRDGEEVRRDFRCENLSAGETRVFVGDVGGDDRNAFRVDLPGEPLRSLPAGGVLEVPVWFRPRPYGSDSFAWVEVLREDEAVRARIRLYASTAD